MKKILLTLLLMTLLSANVLGQANISFEYNGEIYYYVELPITTFDQVGDDYTLLEADNDDLIVVVDKNGTIWVIECE